VTVLHDAAGQLVEIRVRWHEVPDFHGSGPRSRHYLLSSLTGEVRFGDGRHGLVPPPGRNNVRMAWYQAGGGLAGNRPAGSIARLKGTVPYVAGVVQSVPAEGGAAGESLDAARIRGPKRLRHRDRATAAADFEDLAFQASPQVARARALPAGSGEGGGQVGLIVVPALDVPKPVPGLELLARVRSYLEARLSPVVDLRVTGPDWLQIDVQAEIVPQGLDAAIDVQNAALERLRAFLHPLSGGPQGEGWGLGHKPYRSDLYTLIEETPGVDHVRWLEVTETPREGGARPGRFQVYSGDHTLTIRGNTDDAATTPGSPA
jgi:predicted phage baseplate assembly protein